MSVSGHAFSCFGLFIFIYLFVLDRVSAYQKISAMKNPNELCIQSYLHVVPLAVPQFLLIYLEA